MTGKAAIATILVLLTAACDGAPDALSPGSTAPGADAAFVDVPAAGQMSGIVQLIAEHEAAWAAKDATAYAATYTVDAEVINPVGGILAGREVIRAQHAFLFNPVNGPFRATTSTWSVRGVTFLTGTIALVKLDVLLTGISMLPPGLPAYEPGVVRTRVSWIAVRRGGSWEIMHQQMTPLPPIQ
jgi:uncharacterized protein (TIGR02246 family)